MAAPTLLPERPVLVAADAIAGLRATQVAAAIGRGLEAAGLMPPDLCPVSPTIESLLPHLGGESGDGYALVEGGAVALLERRDAEVAATAAGAGLVVVLGEQDAKWLLDRLDFDARMRAARCVLLATHRLDTAGWPATTVFEIGTRTRQGGVPLHAVAAEDELDAFHTRMIDLQHVAQAATLRDIEDAAERVAALL